MVKFMRADNETLARIAELEQRVAALESGAAPKPRPSDRQVFDRASRVSDLTPEEREFLRRVRCNEMGWGGSYGLSWQTRYDLETLASRAPETAPQQPIEALLAAASSAAQLNEREVDEIRAVRQWLTKGPVPDYARQQLERIVALRGS